MVAAATESLAPMMMNVQLVSMTAINMLLALIHTVLLLASVMAATPEMDLLALITMSVPMTLTTVNLTLSASTPMAPLLVRPIL